MQKWLILAAAAAALTSFAPASSMAQGVVVGVPGVGGVQIGEPDRPRYRDREYRDDRRYREREARGGCEQPPSSATMDQCGASVARLTSAT